MKKIFFIGLIILTVNVNAQTICEGKIVVPVTTFDQCDNNPWVLVFEDNFDGNNLDLSTWELQAWGQGALYGNNGSNQEYNTLDNIEVSNGVLKIIAKKEIVQRRAISWKPDGEILEDGLPNLRTYNYTSSNIWTKRKFSYGKFEARIKIPKGKGFWPAFWTFGGNPWNELDVFEFWNENDAFNNYDPTKLSKVHHMTAHYDFDNDGNTNMCGTKYNGVDFSQDFHIFTLIWEKNKIEWYVDGQLKRTDYRYYTMLGQTTGCTINAGTQYIMNRIYPVDPMAIILNLAIQHGTDDYGNIKSPDNSTPFPSQMEVDWVRYYSKHPYQNVYISGASLICTSDNSSFVINNIPQNSSITWTHSSNLTSVGCDTCTTFTVKSVNSWVKGNGWVKANVNGIIFTKTFWVGVPGQPVTNPSGYPTIQLSLGQIKSIRVTSATGNPYQYIWEVTGSIDKISGSGSQIVIEAARIGWGNFKVKTRNSCGYSSYGGGSVNVSLGGGGGWLMLISPNPTTTEASITIKPKYIKEKFDQNQQWDIEVYNQNYMLQEKQSNLKGNTFKLNTSSWKEGIYYIKAICKGEVVSGKLILKK